MHGMIFDVSKHHQKYNCKLCGDNIITYAVETVEGDVKVTEGIKTTKYIIT